MLRFRYLPLLILALLSFAILACSSDDSVVVQQPEPAQEPEAPVSSSYIPETPKQPEVPAAAPAAIVPAEPIALQNAVIFPFPIPFAESSASSSTMVLPVT